jgi:aldehyde dehydrogenase (NAD+)
VDKVAFTGSLNTGLDIMRNSHVHNLKRVTLELGGKSANIITRHADLAKAVNEATWGTFFNAGQVCIAGTRVFVHSSLYDRFVEESVKRARSIKLGSALDPNADQGPQISRKQMDRVLGYIQKGVE